MKGKPIEPGCRALIVGYRPSNVRSANNGRVVQVVKKLHTGDRGPNGMEVFATEGYTWVVEAQGAPLVTKTNFGRILYTQSVVVRPRNLIRIDDNDENLDRVVEQSKPVIKTKPIEEIF